MHGVRRMHRARGAGVKRAFGFPDPAQPNSDPFGSFLTQIFHQPANTPAPSTPTPDAISSSSTPVPKTSSSSSSKVVPSSKSSSSSSSSSPTPSPSPTPTPTSTSTLSSSSIAERTTTMIVEAPVDPAASSAAPSIEAPKSFLQNTALSASVFTLIALVALAIIGFLVTMSIRARRKAREEMEIHDALSSMMVADDYSDDGSHDALHIHRAQPSTFTFSTSASAGHAGYGAFGRGKSPLPDMPQPAHSAHYAETGPLMSQQAFSAATFNPSLYPAEAANVAPVYNPAKRVITPSIMTSDTQFVNPDTPLTPPTRAPGIPPSPTGSAFSLGVPSDPRLIRRGSLLDNNPESAKSSERSDTPTYFLNPTRGSEIPQSPAALPAKFGQHEDEDESDPYGGLEYGELPSFEFSRSLKVANE